MNKIIIIIALSMFIVWAFCTIASTWVKIRWGRRDRKWLLRETSDLFPGISEEAKRRIYDAVEDEARRRAGEKKR